ncbi:MAG: exodeoxyribonuclease V subunit gamma [Candidatus Dasytiphilus stammeri]
MFILYQSNQVEILRFLMSYHLNKKGFFDNPFDAAEEILVPSKNIIPWLERSITEQIDITANIKFTLIETFIWNILGILHDIPPKHLFNKETIKWKIIEIIPRLLNQPEFILFKQYLSIHSDNQLFILATYLSELYSQYLVYRPEWLIKWEKKQFTEIDPSQIWQGYLWSELINYTQQLNQSICHIANLYPSFLKKLKLLKNTIHLKKVLPKRLFIFNISRLPPLYLTILEVISKHIDIHCFLLNPCRHYWGDIYEYQNETASNSILKSWGKLGRDTLFFLSQFEQIHEINAFVDVKRDNILHSLQQDILELKDYTTIVTENNINQKRLFHLNDNSIQVHISYSLEHELEVLQEQLYNLIRNDLSLTLNDIIVMVTDINLYIPFIQAVFGNTNSKYYLPFSICDQSINQIYHPLVRSFISLLRIVEEEILSLDKIVSLLEIPSFAMQFHISKENLANLHQFLSQSENSMKYDYNENQIEEFFESNKKQFGSKLAEKINKIYIKFYQWRKILLQPHVVSDWKKISSEIIDNFFLIDTDQKIVIFLTFIKQKWYRILEDAIHCDNLIPIQFLYNELIMQLNQITLNMHLMKNCINFCSLTSIRLIPFKIVCILGMNDGIYPRISSLISYNLILQHPHIGDISQRDNDRYLFLETLLSAREIFYVSYIGSSIPGNVKQLPSIFINEILNYIAHSYYWPEDNNISDCENTTDNIKKHLQYFHERYHISLNPNNNSMINSIFNMVLPNKIINELNIQKFLDFWQHPVRAFFNNRLGVKFFSTPKVTSLNQPLIFLDNINYYKFKTQLLTTLIKGNNPNNLFELYRTKGLLADGIWVEFFLQKLQHSMDNLVQIIKKYYHSNTTRNIPIDLTVRGIRLTGYLSHVQSNGLVRWRCTSLNFRDGLLLWLEHLIYCIINGNNKSNSIMFGKNNTQWSFGVLSSQEALDHLIPFIEGYQLGMNSPILLLPQTGGAWLKASYDKKKSILDYDEKTQLKARQRLLMTWMCHKNGESHDPYLQRLFRTMDESCITEVIKNAESWLLPIMHFNQLHSI